jgi:hypothetical protein
MAEAIAEEAQVIKEPDGRLWEVVDNPHLDLA